MCSVSDILAVGPNQFYFTNEAYNKEPIVRLFEHYMMFRWGGLVFCDGATCMRASFPLYEPSGLHMSADGKWVWAKFNSSTASGVELYLIIQNHTSRLDPGFDVVVYIKATR